MKATTVRALKFIEESAQLEMPIYQRAYSWDKELCEQLLEDIAAVAAKQTGALEPTHFIGSLIYIQKPNGRARFVIDGQQRLATIALIVEALARSAEENAEQAPVSAEELRRRHLFSSGEDGGAGRKLLLSETDKETLIALATQEEPPENYSIRIMDNFSFFERAFKKASAKEMEAVWKGLNRLTMVAIALDPLQDRPQRIFESMNDRGIELSNADLIRNYVLMNLKAQEQTQLYNASWQPIENRFGQTEAGFDQEAYSKHFDEFIRYYLGMKNRALPTKAKIYDEFKIYANKQEDVKSFVENIHAFAGYYAAIKLGQEPELPLKAAFSDLQLLKTNTPMPFLLELYERYVKRGIFAGMLSPAQFQAANAEMGFLTMKQLEEAVRVIESYLVRRIVCGLSTSLGAHFASICRSIDNERFVENVRGLFRSLTGTTRRCPGDSEFQHELKTRNLYNAAVCPYILRRMENHGRKEPLDLDEHDVEPILPAESPLPPEWQEELGVNWNQTHEELAGTLGNLTLTKGARHFADSPFGHKRDLETGYRRSPLWLNNLPGKAQRWDAQAIQERAEALAERALEVWRMP